MTLTISTRSMKPHPQMFWACGKLWWEDLRVQGVRLSACATLLAFLTLLTVSGPHLIHHFTESHPQEARHPHAGHAPQAPDCHILFLLQHTPVAEHGIALLPILLLAAEPILVISPLVKVEAPQYTFQARAPPATPL